MRPNRCFIATTALILAVAAGAQAVNLSRYKYTVHTDVFSATHQLDLQILRGLCRDDDGCQVIIQWDDGSNLDVKTTRLLLKGTERWRTEGGSAMFQDNDHSEDVVLKAGTDIYYCEVSDSEETGGDDSAAGFSVYLSPNVLTCVVTFID